MDGTVSIINPAPEEFERPRRAKIAPPESIQAAGRRKGPARLGVKKSAASTAKRALKKTEEENTPTQTQGSLRLRLSSKLLDFDAEGTFSLSWLQIVTYY